MTEYRRQRRAYIHDPRRYTNRRPFGVNTDDMVYVAGSDRVWSTTPFPASAVYWGSGADCDNPVRYYARAIPIEPAKPRPKATLKNVIAAGAWLHESGLRDASTIEKAEKMALSILDALDYDTTDVRAELYAPIKIELTKQQAGVISTLVERDMRSIRLLCDKNPNSGHWIAIRQNILDQITFEQTTACK